MGRMRGYHLAKLFKFTTEKELEIPYSYHHKGRKSLLESTRSTRDGSIRKLWISKGKDKEGNDRWALVQAGHSIGLTELRLTMVVFGIEILVSLC